MNHIATKAATSAKKPSTAMSAIAHLGTGSPLPGSLFCSTEGPLVLAMEETTLLSVAINPLFEDDNSDREDERSGGIELPIDESDEMTDDKEDCADEIEAPTAVRPAKFVIVLRSPVRVSGIEPRSVGPLNTIEVATAGGMPLIKLVGAGVAPAASDNVAAEAAAFDAMAARDDEDAAASCEASVAGGAVCSTSKVA